MRSLHAAVFLLILAITQTEELPLATLVRFRAGWRGHEQIGRTSTSGAICTSNRLVGQIGCTCLIAALSMSDKSSKQLNDKRSVPRSISWRVRHIALGGGISVYPALAARKAGHGNDRVWKGWNAMKPASHPFHTPSKITSGRVGSTSSMPELCCQE
jgi:hypothetical protein